MKRIYFSLIFIVLVRCMFAQTPSFTVLELPSMPEPVSNNAVVSAMCGDTLCVYSFCGIDETKTPSGIHLKAWRYNTVTQVWTALPNVPDDTGNGKIAAGASVVNNKIYLIGGYYVEDNFSELSSDDVHVFNPETNEWEEDGALIPIPIDDHVQAVWNESLIYIVTGWSNNGNVNNVQIYNPLSDSWMIGNPPLNNSDYKVFGGSGEFLGNQLVYHGGVRSNFGFFPTSEVRKGTVNPLDPSDISWEIIGDSELGTTYRAAALSLPTSNSILWIGGAELGYNFDGIDYNGSGGVNPTSSIKVHNIYTDEVMSSASVVFNGDYSLPMDLRGIARVTSMDEEEITGVHQSILCGGMKQDQEVSALVFLITGSEIVGVENIVPDNFSLQWKMSNDEIRLESENNLSSVIVRSLDGKEVLRKNLNSKFGVVKTCLISRGVYVLTVRFSEGKVVSRKLVIE